ncbi:MAG: hypothetical protein HYW88_00245, partial [Candidatus Sungbacteria bacterium]|nr:hypothetical protein [Candidatus Sungbacteria bacterium]
MAETLKKPFVALLFVLFLGAIFRFMLISDLPPGLYPDEAMNGNNALEALRNTNLSAKNGPSFGWKIFYPENNGREGLFINIQALSVYTFGNTAWALRIVSSLFGTLTILGLYLVAKELFWGIQTPSRDISERKKKVIHPHLNMYNPGAIALFAAFFIATNYWHINFSRIGFRAIMLPLVCTFGFYWLLKALRTGKISSAVLGGIIFGLGFHTYIAFRIAPLVIAFVVLWYSWLWWKERGREAIAGVTKTCAPCILALFLFATFVTALPIGYYFLQHRGDLVGRQTQVSVFGSDNPVKALALSTIKTFGMFNIIGDCNQRHNYKCKPELFWPVG